MRVSRLLVVFVLLLTGLAAVSGVVTPDRAAGAPQRCPSAEEVSDLTGVTVKRTDRIRGDQLTCAFSATYLHAVGTVVTCPVGGFVCDVMERMEMHYLQGGVGQQLNALHGHAVFYYLPAHPNNDSLGNACGVASQIQHWVAHFNGRANQSEEVYYVAQPGFPSDCDGLTSPPAA